MFARAEGYVKLLELMQSIGKEGVVLVLTRSNPVGEGDEIKMRAGTKVVKKLSYY